MSDVPAFNLAIVGAGGISGAHSAAALASNGRVVVSAVVDLNEQSRTALAAKHNARNFASIGDLLDAIDAGDVRADGVVVCTPPSARIPIVAACMAAGLHVLSEKPLAHTLADARKLAALARKHRKVRTAVAYCHRFTPAVLRMKELLNEGRIGNLARFENVFACDLPGHQQKWFSDPKKAGGGAYLDMGSHSVDLFHAVVGPSRTTAAVFAHKWKGRTETGASVLLESVKAAPGTRNNKPGVAGLIVSGWAESCRFTLALVGDAGMLFYDYEKPADLVFKDLSGKNEVIAVEPHDVRFNRQLIAFADYAQNKARTPLASFDDGLHAAEAFDRAAKLAR